jgi:Tfp pilus assembly protein PilN
MRPVNLLPEGHRPRSSAQRSHGGHLVVVGLAVLLLATLAYVMTANLATSRKDKMVKVEQETRQAEARAKELGGFGQFAQLKQTREASVKQIAQGRFDWERSMRELARVLPRAAWLTELKASTSDEAASNSATSATPGGGASATGTGPQANSPSLVLSGCARTQPDVATTLVRLRRLYRAQDVDLAESSRSGEAGSTASSSASSSDTGGDCGRGYSFNLTVKFGAASAPTEQTKAVPTSLGGGS